MNQTRILLLFVSTLLILECTTFAMDLANISPTNSIHNECNFDFTSLPNRCEHVTFDEDLALISAECINALLSTANLTEVEVRRITRRATQPSDDETNNTTTTWSPAKIVRYPDTIWSPTKPTCAPASIESSFEFNCDTHPEILALAGTQLENIDDETDNTTTAWPPAKIVRYPDTIWAPTKPTCTPASLRSSFEFNCDTHPKSLALAGAQLEKIIEEHKKYNRTTEEQLKTEILIIHLYNEITREFITRNRIKHHPILDTVILHYKEHINKLCMQSSRGLPNPQKKLLHHARHVWGECMCEQLPCDPLKY